MGAAGEPCPPAVVSIVTVTISLGAMVTLKDPSAPIDMSVARAKKELEFVRHTARGVPGPGSPPDVTNVTVCGPGGAGCEQRPAESVSRMTVNAPRSGRTSVV